MPSRPPATQPSRRDARANRERIVVAARAAFAAGGLEVSVEEIAHRAGVGMGTLYRHFPTKEDMIDAALEHAVEELATAAEQALDEQDPWAGLCRFLERSFAFHAENRGLKDVVATGEHGHERLEAMRARLWPPLAQLVERGQAQGALRADLAPEDLPLLLWAGARVIECTTAVAPELWRRHLHLMLDGLRAERATPLPHPPLTRSQLRQAGGTRPR